VEEFYFENRPKPSRVFVGEIFGEDSRRSF